MVSLTTVYGISIFLTSLAGMGSAFVGNKIYPIKGGAVEVLPTPTEEAPAPETPAPQPEAATPPTPEELNTLEEAIKTGFNMDEEFAKNVVDFIKTPVANWETIAPTPSELRRKFMKTLTHANQNKCPAKLIDLCKIVSIKYSNMKDSIEGNAYMPYGDQTAEALALLSSTEQT